MGGIAGGDTGIHSSPAAAVSGEGCRSAGCTTSLTREIEIEDVLGDLVRAPDARASGSTIAVAATGHTRRRNVWISALVLLALERRCRVHARPTCDQRSSPMTPRSSSCCLPRGRHSGRAWWIGSRRLPSRQMAGAWFFSRRILLAEGRSGFVRSGHSRPSRWREPKEHRSPSGRLTALLSRSLRKASSRKWRLREARRSRSPTRRRVWVAPGIVRESLCSPLTDEGPAVSRPDAGGVPAPVTALDAERQERAHVLPQFLPDGRHFIYLVRAREPHGGVYVASLDSRETKRLLSTGQKGMYAPPGYLLFLRDGTCWRSPSTRSPRRHRENPCRSSNLSRSARPMAGQPTAFRRTASWRIAPAGSQGRANWSGPIVGYEIDRCRCGRRLRRRSDSRLTNPLAAELHDLRTGTGDLWLLDLKRGSTTRFTLTGLTTTTPCGRPMEHEIVFAARAQSDGVANLHHKPQRAALRPMSLCCRRVQPESRPIGRSDGRYILFEEDPSEDANRPLDPADAGRKPSSISADGVRRTKRTVFPTGTGSPMCRMRVGETKSTYGRFPRRAGSGRSRSMAVWHRSGDATGRSSSTCPRTAPS